MAYWDRPLSTSSPSLDSVSLSSKRGGGGSSDAFYEIEPAVVLDIMLDTEHPYFNATKFKLTETQWPVDINNKPPLPTDPDYTWMGRALVRLLYNQRNIEKEDLVWAMPLESNLSEYPVLNEIVGVVFYLGKYYYTKKINAFNTPNANADFNIELSYGGFRVDPNAYVQGNRELLLNPKAQKIPYVGPISKLNAVGSIGYAGALGRYFYYNPRIRSLKRREGDLVFESRFGQSIRFASYDDDRKNDKGYVTGEFSGYTDYKCNGTTYVNYMDGAKYEAGGGNPMILIRNRQRPLDKTNVDEKNVGGYMLEDINADGSSIHITSGVTVSNFQTSCKKKMWGMGEEQPAFNGQTSFKYPKLWNDQIVINTDRVIIQARTNEMFQYSKKRMSFVTDDEYTVDAQNQIVLNTNNKTVLNSPAIYLGEYNQTNEPVLLGQTSVNWLYDLCQWLLAHTHWYNHNHPDAQGGTTGNSQEPKTQTTVQAASLIVLRDQLNLLMSRRVFTVGGGLAPGFNGGSIQDGVAPVTITTPAGSGVPGGWSGSNRKYSATEKQKIASELEQTKALADSVTTSASSAKTALAAAAAAQFEAGNNLRIVKNNVTVAAAVVARQQAAAAKTNSAAAAKYADQAKQFAATAQSTDNDFVRMEAETAAKDAADKAKYYSNLADSNMKAANAALAQSKAEVAKKLAQYTNKKK